MEITIGGWVVPMLPTLIFLFMMLRPYKQTGDYDFGAMFRLFWFVPISICWLVYAIFIIVSN